MDADEKWPRPTQWLSRPGVKEVVDYDGESLRMTVRKDCVVFRSFGEGGLFLSPEDARRMLKEFEELLDEHERTK